MKKHNPLTLSLLRLCLAAMSVCLIFSSASAQRAPPAPPTPEAGMLSDMPFASTPFDGSELIYVVQGGISKKTNLLTAVFMGVAFPAFGSNPTSIATAATRFNHILNIDDDYGARADTLRAKCNVTTTAGQTAITLASCTNFLTGAAISTPLTGANVSKGIAINYIGALLPTSPVATIPLATHGNTYRDIPTVIVTDSTGTGAYAFANMELSAATLTYGGTGCTGADGTTQPLTITDGIYSIQGIVSATVTGGVFSGALTITNPGLWQAFLNPANMLSPHAIFLTGPGCITQPIMDATFDVASLTFVNGGQQYTAPTAAFSDGNATIGALTLSLPVAAMLKTTIATVTSATTGTLATPALQTLANKSVYVQFTGTDNKTNIQNALNDKAAAGLSGSPVYIPVPPPGYCYGVGSPLEMPDNYPILIRGGGPGSILCGTGPMEEVLHKGSGAMDWGSQFEDFVIDGEKMATYAYLGVCNTTQRWNNVDLRNAAPYGTIHSIGDGVSTCAGGTLTNVKESVDRFMYTGHFDDPLWCLVVRNSDVDGKDGKAMGCDNGVQFILAAGSHLNNQHNSSFDQMTQCFDVFAVSVTLKDPECDRGAIIGIHIRAGDALVEGGLINTKVVDPVQFGVLVEDNLPNINIHAFYANDVVIPVNRVKWNGRIGKNSSSLNVLAWPTFSQNTTTALCQGIKTTLATGVPVETPVLDCPIPAGITGFNGTLTVDAVWSLVGTANCCDRFNIRIGNSLIVNPATTYFDYGMTRDQPQTAITASIAATTMTVTNIASGGILQNNQILSGSGVTDGTTIVSQLTGPTGGVGTYTISASQTVGSEAITATTNWTSLWMRNVIRANNSLLQQVTRGPTSLGLSTTASNTAGQSNITASIAATTMTVTAIASGSVQVNNIYSGTGVTDGTQIVNQLTGSPGDVGTYTVSISQTTPSTAMTSTALDMTQNGDLYLLTRLFGTNTSRLLGYSVFVTPAP